MALHWRGVQALADSTRRRHERRELEAVRKRPIARPPQRSGQIVTRLHGAAPFLVRESISQRMHESLEEMKVPHRWHVHAGGGHDFRVWKPDLFHFLPLLFR